MPTKAIQFRVKGSVYLAIQVKAAREGKKPATIARELVEKWLKGAKK